MPPFRLGAADPAGHQLYLIRRIQRGIAQINDKVGEDEDRREEQDATLEDGKVLGQNGSLWS